MEVIHNTEHGGTQMPEHILKHVMPTLSFAQHVLDGGEEVEMTGFVYSAKKDEMIFMHVSSLPSKDMVAQVIRQVAEEKEATLVMFLSEGYALPDEFIEAQLAGTSGYANISDHPEHYEILMLNVESTDGNWMGKARFHGKLPNRTLDPMEFFSTKKTEEGGRFNGLLPQQAAAPQ